MIDRLIALSLRNRVLVIAIYLGLAGWGYWAWRATPIDAIPDLSDNQVIVFTEWPGHSAQEVEDQVTYPVTVNLQGLAGVRVVRSQSAFGFSMTYVVFDDGVDLYFARGRVLERMSLITKLLPEGVTPTLGPDATGVGHVFWYTLESPTHSLRELRTLQDWFVRYQLNARRYTDEDLNRVQFVKAAKALGFTLNEIGALLKLEDGTHCNEVRVIAEQKLADVREKLNQLQRMESTLQRVVVDCQTTNKNVCCPLIASLQVNH